jgi:hypothetical protein
MNKGVSIRVSITRHTPNITSSHHITSQVQHITHITAHHSTAQVTNTARRSTPHYLSTCGGVAVPLVAALHQGLRRLGAHQQNVHWGGVYITGGRDGGMEGGRERKGEADIISSEDNVKHTIHHITSYRITPHHIPSSHHITSHHHIIS